jgi:hypothetical protein
LGSTQIPAAFTGFSEDEFAILDGVILEPPIEGLLFDTSASKPRSWRGALAADRSPGRVR